MPFHPFFRDREVDSELRQMMFEMVSHKDKLSEARPSVVARRPSRLAGEKSWRSLGEVG